MPSLGADMTDGTLLEWLVHPGDPVHHGDIVAVVDTDKAAIDVECFTDGVVQDLVVEPGHRVPVGTVLATIADAAPPPTAPPDTAPPDTAPPAGAPPPAAVRAPAPPTGDGGGPSSVLSPLVRRLAAARHVDLTALHGSGPGARIMRIDVERAAAAPTRVRSTPLARRLARELQVDLTAVPTAADGVVHAGQVRHAADTVVRRAPNAPVAASAAADRTATMRTTIAALMARSKREIPHYYLTESVDLAAAMTWLRERNRRLPVTRRIVPAALLLKASALAARQVPQLNGFWGEHGFVPGGGVHVGVAVSLRGGGLVAPAIHDADQLDLAALMARMRDLVTRSRGGRLRGSEMADPTITVSNVGEQGSESILGVIYPPQVALVGFGRIVDRPWAVDGLIGVRPVVSVGLAADHRATDGAIGSRFLSRIARLVQKPEEL
ncbi:2-oxo acid dehydrogenase subunit E2 [Dactylosporangium aurantiacum]|uniref:Dihydrolipoamide acetyltransferase component of pyruvate dehydrogenase complex n=2 Tax=Dactylosporangium aurantiacum TaxID=35754 RepID=A0A9Q9INY5_9ACTN|nr:2-oxo acid dehydrogenase subunit E2 [Dactylosporangium aurantiacum]